MYLKFGFGRANQDACIDIRRGAMDRIKASTLLKCLMDIFHLKNWKRIVIIMI